MDLAVTSFLLGLFSTTSPCVLPLYPGFLAYLAAQTQRGLGRQRYFLGFFVLAGVLTMMLALGGLIALLAVPISSALVLVIPAANLLLFLLGVMLLFDRNPFMSLPQIQIPALRRAGFTRPFPNAFLYGLCYGPIALPCAGPLIVSIFALSFTLNEAFDKLWVFMWFGLGFGLPLLLLSLLSGTFQRRLTIFLTMHSRRVHVLGGMLLIGIAIYDMAQNWDMLQLFYSQAEIAQRALHL